MAQYDINLRDYWRIIRKRKIIIIFTTVTLSVFSFIFAKMNEPPPIYSSSSAISIEQNTSVSGLVQDTAAASFQDIATQTAVIRSYPVMEKVAKELGMVDKALTSDEIAKNSRLVAIINSLASQVATEQIGETNLISITVTSGDPDQAARMANTVASVYRQFDFEKRNETVLKQKVFLDSQLKNSEDRLKKAEEAIKSFKEKNKFLSISIEASSLSRTIQRLEEIVSGLRKKYDQVRDAIAQLRSVGEFRAGTTTRIPVDEIDPALARLNEQLVQLQVRRDNLLENFTQEHPAIVETVTKIRNTAREMLATLQGREQILLAELKLREKTLADLEARNKAVPDISLQLQRLERRLATNMEVHNLLRQKAEEVKIKIAGLQNLVRIVKPAFRPTRRDNPPNVGVNTFVGAILGLIVGLVFALIIETMDTSIGAIEDVEAYLEVPVLGVIPTHDLEELEQQYLETNPDKEGHLTPEMFSRLVTHFVPRSPLAEAYRAFRTQVDFISLEKGGNTFLLTSSTPGEGKTTTAINFAVTCAQTNKRTLLIDADLRKPTIYRIFGIDREPGLTDILLGNHAWDECVRTMTDIMLGKFDMEDIMLTPGLDNLNILTCGHIPPNPSELLNSTRMTQFLNDIRQEFDVIVLDTPPVLPVTDAAVLGTRVDGCVLVYRAGAIARGALKRAKVQLENVRANVWGVVLNSMRAETSPDLDTVRYTSSYYYGGYYEDASDTSILEMPFYQRLYRRAKEKLFVGEDESVQAEASLLARVLTAGLLILSFALTAGGFAWQAGVNVPLFGSLRKAQATIGVPAKEPRAIIEQSWAVNKALNQKSKPAAEGGGPKARKEPAAEKGRDDKGKAKPAPRQGAFQRPARKEKRLSRALRPAPPAFPSSVLTRRVALQLAGQGTNLQLASAGYPRRPFSVIYSANRLRETTVNQMRHLRREGLAPVFTPVSTPEGPMDRLFLGAFESREAAEAFRREKLLPAVQKGVRPLVDNLPYALEVARGGTPAEGDLMRVILKAVGLSSYLQENEETKERRTVVGAFRSPKEAEAAGRLLQQESIPFRVILR